MRGHVQVALDGTTRLLWNWYEYIMNRDKYNQHKNIIKFFWLVRDKWERVLQMVFTAEYKRALTEKVFFNA